MKYKPFIKNAPEVSEIGLGAWQLGINSGWKDVSEKEAIEQVHQSIELGINFFDTAPIYGHGTSEIRLGKALKNFDRSKMVINTKFGHSEIGSTDYSSTLIRESVEGSLKRMQLDYIDSVIMHNPPMELLDGNQTDHYEIFERLKEEGKIKAYGASLDTYEEMKLLIETTGSEVIEAFFNILFQDTARAFSMAKQKGVGIIVKIPLDSGWLSGKYNAEFVFHDIRQRWSRNDIQTRARLVNRVKEILGAQRNIAQSAIAFCLTYDAVSTVIPGNTTIKQLKENVESISTALHPDLIRELEMFYQNEVKELNLPW